MSKKKYLLFTILLTSFLNLEGCTELNKLAKEWELDWKIRNCNVKAAYNNGIDDARHGREVNTDYAQICSENQAAINIAYRKGYKMGTFEHIAQTKQKTN